MLGLLLLLGPGVAWALDTTPPTLNVTAHSNPGVGQRVTFTFFFNASDDTGLDVPGGGIEYRERINGQAFSNWITLPYNPTPAYDPEKGYSFSLNCNLFEAQFRAVDKAGNRSAVVSRSFSFPYPNNPPPDRAPKFAAPTTLSVPGAGRVVGLVANLDFDGDGDCDIAHVQSDGWVKVRLNDGTGTGSSGGYVNSIGGNVTALAAGFISDKTSPTANDTLPDLVVVKDGVVRVFINQWDGTSLTFAEQGSGFSVANTNFSHVAVADLDGDGFAEIVASGVATDAVQGRVAYFSNRGTTSPGGINASATVRTAGTGAGDLAIGDLDGDGAPDVVTVNPGLRHVHMLKASGGAAILIGVTHKTRAVTVGDFTGDGKLDVATFGTDYGADQVGDPQQNYLSTFILSGPGDGTLPDRFGVLIGTQVGPEQAIEGDLAVGEVTGDRFPELIVTNYFANQVQVQRLTPVLDSTNRLDYFVVPAQPNFAATTGPVRVAVADMNGDGKLDIVAGGESSATGLAVLLNTKSSAGTAFAKFDLSGKMDSAAQTDIQFAEPGELLTCRFEYSNPGADQTDTVLTCVVPPLLTVQFTDANDDQIDDTYGFRKIESKGRISAVTWDLGTVLASGTGVKRFAAAVSTAARPVTKLTVSGTIKSSRKTATRSAKVNVFVRSSVRLTLSSQQGTVQPGGVVEFRIKAKNLGNYFAPGVKVIVPVPAQTGLLIGAGGHPAFLGPDFQPTTRLNADTQTPAIASGGFPFIDPANPRKTRNPGWSEDRRTVGFWVGTMGPNEEVLMRVMVKLAYDANDSGTVVLQNVTGQQRTAGRRVSGGGEIYPDSAAPSVTRVPAAPGAARPELALEVQTEAAGSDIDPGDSQPIALVAQKATRIPGTTPERKTNQIRYTTTYKNLGNAVAESLRIFLLVPPGTVLDRNSVSLGDESGERKLAKSEFKLVRLPDGTTEVGLPEIDDTLADGGFLAIDVPFLEADFPATGSGKTVSYTVTLQAPGRRNAAAIGDQVTMFGFIRSDMLVGLPYLGAAALSTPLVSKALVAEPVLLERIRGGVQLDNSTADNRLLTAQAFYTNSGGLPAQQVVAVASIPTGATFESAELLNDAGQSVTNIAPVVNGGFVSMPLANYAAGQKYGTLTAGQKLHAIFRYRTTNAAVPRNVSSVLAHNVVPSLYLFHSGDFVPEASSRERQVVRNASSTGLPAGLQYDMPVYTPNPNSGRAGVWVRLVSDPATVKPGALLTFRIIVANPSNFGLGAGVVAFPIPENTTYETSSQMNYYEMSGMGTPYSSSYSPENNRVVWTSSPGPHGASTATVTVRVVAQPTSSSVVSRGAYVSGDLFGYAFAANCIVPILGGVASPADVRTAVVRAVAGADAPTAGGEVDTLNEANLAFADDVKRIGSSANINAIGGVDFIHLKNGVILIPIGADRIVAAGAGNLVGNSGNTLIGQDGGSIVAAGAGNLISLPGIAENLTQPNLYNIVATIAQQQSGTLLPGATSISALVAAGGGNILPSGAGNLVGNNGNTFRAIVDNSSLTGAAVQFSGSPVLITAQFELVPELTKLVDRLGSNFTVDLTAQPGPGIITFGDDSLVTGGDGHLIGQDGGSLIGQDGGSMVAAGAGNMVAAGGGNVLSTYGAGAVRERGAAAVRKRAAQAPAR